MYRYIFIYFCLTTHQIATLRKLCSCFPIFTRGSYDVRSNNWQHLATSSRSLGQSGMQARRLIFYFQASSGSKLHCNSLVPPPSWKGILMFAQTGLMERGFLLILSYRVIFLHTYIPDLPNQPDLQNRPHSPRSD